MNDNLTKAACMLTKAQSQSSYLSGHYYDHKTPAQRMQREGSVSKENAEVTIYGNFAFNAFMQMILSDNDNMKTLLEGDYNYVGVCEGNSSRYGSIVNVDLAKSMS